MVDDTARPKHVAGVVPCAALAICTTLFLFSGLQTRIRIWDAKLEAINLTRIVPRCAKRRTHSILGIESDAARRFVESG